MHKRSDVPRTQPEKPEVEYYKTLARLTEDRAREIRRIAALERARLEKRLLEQEAVIKGHAEERDRLRGNYERLKASSQRSKDTSQRLKIELASTKTQIKAFEKTQKTLGASRAHRLAAAYVRFVSGRSLFAQTFRLIRPVAHALSRIRRALSY